MTRRKVMIRFLSERAGLSMNGLPVLVQGGSGDRFAYENEAEEEERLEELLSAGEETPEVSEMLVEGRLITTTHRVELVYEELLSDIGPTITKIGFDRAAPELVTMLRSGASSTALVFEDRRRHICVYNIPSTGFEICISTAEVDNRLLTDGVLKLDYYMEVHGVQTDHCRLEITVQDTD